MSFYKYLDKLKKSGHTTEEIAKVFHAWQINNTEVNTLGVCSPACSAHQKCDNGNCIDDIGIGNA